MTLVRPASVRLVAPPWAESVVSPLRDVLTEAERREVLARNPHSYLHVTNEAPVPAGPARGVPGGDEQADALRRLLDQGAYDGPQEPGVFVYRMRESGHEHTGLVASVALAGFTDGRVLGHERVQDERVDGLVRHFERVPMRSELVALFHTPGIAVAELTGRIRDRTPLLAFTDAGGVEQAVWRAGPEEAAAVTQHLDRHRLYIADGHHRVAAAVRRWQLQGRPASGAVLCAIYPEDQLSMHAFHRRVAGPVDVAALLEALGHGFAVEDAPGPVSRAGSLGLYAAGRWHLLTPRTPRTGVGVAGLDVTLLDEQVLRPLLGRGDSDPNVEFVPQLRDLAPTLAACDHDGGVLFVLHPPRLDELVSVAERREVMSAKTTYVKPKPRTGVFLHAESHEVCATP